MLSLETVLLHVTDLCQSVGPNSMTPGPGFGTTHHYLSYLVKAFVLIFVSVVATDCNIKCAKMSEFRNRNYAVPDKCLKDLKLGSDYSNFCV